MTIDLDDAQLTRIAQRALDAPSATLVDYDLRPLGCLTGELRVPRTYEIDLAEDSHVALWLERIHATEFEEWPLEMYATPAHALGEFNGAFLVRPLPVHPWLVRD